MAVEGPRDDALFLFDSSTHVMWAEEVAREEGIPVEVVPAPTGVKDICGLALRTLAMDAGHLESVLMEEGITFRRHA